MANTYSQIHLHFIFATKYRAALIQPKWEPLLYQYITGIVQTYGHKLLCINGMPDHIHLLIGLRPTQSAADLMHWVKGGSSQWIHENDFCKSRFERQAGYGVFSCAKADIPPISLYIENQKIHHKKKSFLDEYADFLEENGIPYSPQYLFKPPL